MMSNTSTNKQEYCTEFLDRLDLWLEGELSPERAGAMQGHHDTCAECRLETRLAREIDNIMHALPEHDYPELALPVVEPDKTAPRPLTSRLLQTWRQPLVFLPALALLLLTVFVLQPLVNEQATAPRTVTINGQSYTEAQIVQAAQDLETALRYLDKYGSYPARVLSTELENSRLPLPSENTDNDKPSI